MFVIITQVNRELTTLQIHTVLNSISKKNYTKNSEMNKSSIIFNLISEVFI